MQNVKKMLPLVGPVPVKTQLIHIINTTEGVNIPKEITVTYVFINVIKDLIYTPILASFIPL